MRSQSLDGRRALALYFVLAFGIAWIGSFVAVGPNFLAGEAIEFNYGGLMALAMLGAPFTAGVMMTYLANGKPGLSELLAVVRKYQVARRWYLPLSSSTASSYNRPIATTARPNLNACIIQYSTCLIKVSTETISRQLVLDTTDGSSAGSRKGSWTGSRSAWPKT